MKGSPVHLFKDHYTRLPDEPLLVASLLVRRRRRSRGVQGRLGMGVADQMHVGREFLQDAAAAVGAVARDHDLPLGKPRGEQREQFDQQFRPCAVIGVGRRPARLAAGVVGTLALGAAFLLPFGESLPVLVEAEAQGQGEDLGRRPARHGDEEGQDHPVVPSADQFEGAAGDERVVVHAGAVQGQAALAAQRVVAGQDNGPRGDEGGDEQPSQEPA